MTDGMFDLEDFTRRLREHGWEVVCASGARPLPEAITERHGSVPATYSALVRELVTCASPTGKIWLVVGDAFEAKPPAFRWNELELMSLEAAEGDEDWLGSIARFWGGHVPLLLDVTSDYDAWLLRLSDGAVVYTFGPDWEDEPDVVASAVEPFLAELARTGRPVREATSGEG